MDKYNKLIDELKGMLNENNTNNTDNNTDVDRATTITLTREQKDSLLKDVNEVLKYLEPIIELLD